MALKLVLPDGCHEQAWKSILAEYKKHGEKMAYGLHMGFNADQYELYLAKGRDSAKGINLPEGFPSKNVFFLMEDGSDEIFGQVTFRHYLNKYLDEVGGHIGYTIRPSKRGKGYGTKQLELALGICRQQGLEEVLLVCNNDNYASAAIIKKCGGEFLNVFIEDNGTVVERYWIRLK